MHDWDYRGEEERSWYGKILIQLPDYIKKIWNSRSEFPIAALIDLCLGVLRLWEGFITVVNCLRKIRPWVEEQFTEFLDYFKK